MLQRSRIYPQELHLKKDIDDFTNITFFPLTVMGCKWVTQHIRGQLMDRTRLADCNLDNQQPKDF